MRLLVVLFLFIVPTAFHSAMAQPFFPVPETNQTEQISPYLARTAGLLAAGGPDTVRIVIYGQSISVQDWWKEVRAFLEKRYPQTPLLVTNRAIGGFSTDRLKLMVENDLVPLSPDLVILHDYGSEEDYEKIIRTIRSRTIAEIAVQTDHIAVGQNEEWHGQHNDKWLPALCKQYNLALFNVRSAWKEYLKRNNLQPKALLTDNVHLNAHGNYLMAGIINRYLAALSPQTTSPLPQTVTVLNRQELVKKNSGILTTKMEGNGAETKWSTSGPVSGNVTVRIDGKKPSQLPACYYYTRPALKPEGFFLTNMGQLLAMQLARNPQEEEWTLTVLETDTVRGQLRFSLRGSLTGEDGTGSSDSLFTSRSGRIVIPADGWFRRKTPGDFGQFAWLSPGDRLHWQVKCMCADSVNPAKAGTVMILKGLSNGPHLLELTGKSISALQEIRIYRPPLKQ